MGIEEKYLEVNGIKTRYFKLGKGEDLVFFGGLFSSVVMCESLVKELSKKYKVYAVEMPGFGKTKSPGSVWSVEDYANHIISFMKLLNIKKPLICTCSGGGLVAISIGLKKKAKRLIMMDAAGIQLPFSSRELFFRLFVIMPAKNIFSKRFSRALAFFFGGVKEVIRGTLDGKIWKIIWKNINRSYDKELKNIETPILFVWGEDDEILSLDYVNRFKRLAKNSRLVRVKGTHLWMVLEYEQVGKLIEDDVI